jgi:hypothetical protein
VPVEQFGQGIAQIRWLSDDCLRCCRLLFLLVAGKNRKKSSMAREAGGA